jgi:hypothetical protein
MRRLMKMSLAAFLVLAAFLSAPESVGAGTTLGNPNLWVNTHPNYQGGYTALSMARNDSDNNVSTVFRDTNGQNHLAVQQNWQDNGTLEVEAHEGGPIRVTVMRAGVIVYQSP